MEMHRYTKCNILGIFLLLATKLHQSASVLEQVFDNLENGAPQHVSVTLLEPRSQSGRTKREAGGCFLEDLMTFSFSLDGEDLVLELSENTNLDMNKAIYVEDGGRIKAMNIPPFFETKCFHDMKNNAAIGVTGRVLVSGGCEYQLEGTFATKNGIFAIYPGKWENSTGSLSHVVRLVNTSLDFTADFVFPENAVKPTMKTDDEWRRGQSQRFRRALTTYSVEVFMVTDSLLYDFWYTRTDIADPNLRATGAMNSIRQYFAFVLNEIDLRYRNIVETDIEFRIKYAGMFISQETTTSPWTTAIATPNPDDSERPFVDSSVALGLFRNWRRDDFTSPVSDHTMLFTKADLTRDGSTSNAGLAYVGGACSDNAVSINENDFHFQGVTVAAHELGHNLGSLHDGDGNDCDPNDYFIMAPSSRVRTGDTERNKWFFTNCTVDYFRTFVSLLSPNCLLTDDSGTDPTEIDNLLTVPAGQFYSIDEQCVLSLGNGSYLCRGFYSSVAEYESVCLLAWCSVPDGSRSCRGKLPGRGTTCGDKKWCIDGACVCDENAPAASDTCPYGDQESGLSPTTCADVADNPRICYQEFYKIRCCASCAAAVTGLPGCEYGDRVTGCDVATCPFYDENTVNNLCCETCAAFTTQRPATSTGTTSTTSTCRTAATTTLPATTTAEATTTLPPTTTAETTTTVPPTTTAEATTTASPTATAEATTTVPPTTTAETTTTVPPKTTAETTTTVPPTTTAEATTTVPPTTTTETTTTVPPTTTAEATTTVLPTTTAEATTTVSPTTIADATTTVPPTTIAETTATVPPTTTGDATTTVPPTTTAEATTTASPTATVEATTTVPPTTTAESTSTMSGTTTEPTPVTVTTTNQATTASVARTTTSEGITGADTTTTSAATVTPGSSCTDRGSLPWIREVLRGGVCDTTVSSCLDAVVDLLETSPVHNTHNLRCKFAQILVNEIGPLLTGLTTEVAGRYISCNRVVCPVPNDTIPILGGRAVAGWYLAVSDDGIMFGNEAIYLPYDSRCVMCTDLNTIPVCSWTDTSCYIGGICYNPGDSNGGACEVCDLGQSLTRWSAPAASCFIDGVCYNHGQLDPSNSCRQCDSSINDFTLSGHGGCTIAPSTTCHPNGAINPANTCQSCDVTRSTNSWSNILIPLNNGGAVACEVLCLYVRNSLASAFSAVCQSANQITDQNFKHMCFVRNLNALPQGICPGNQARLQRWAAMCQYTRATDAASDPQVCP